MATQFDATARINVDLRGFAQAANEVTRSGGSMSRIFQNLHQQLNQLEATNKKVSNDLFRLLSAFNQISTAAQKYASAIQALNRADASKGPEQMARAFQQLREALNGVSGLSARETERLGRTTALYNQLASALQKVARSYQIIRSVSQADTKMSQAAERQAQAAQRLAIEQRKVEVAAQRAANAQRRLNAELRGSSDVMGRFGQSSFAARSSLGEIEQQGRLLLNVFRDMGTVIAGSAISQEKAFAQVSRVVGEAQAEAAGLLKSFQDIAAQSPISFEEVSRIGQLGAQIGISADELAEFTNTITMFSLTTNVAADQATLLLGRISEMQNVPTNQMENLGSAILALGTASAATEEEILRINESIATVSNIFGLTAQAVTGLASAMATLRIRPELARGSLTRVFGELDKAVQSGGESLEKLSDVMGMTAQEIVNLRNQNPDEFFLAFVKGLGTAAEEAGGFQQVIRDLGINAVRDIDTLSRLGNNFDVLSESFARSNAEWAKGSELSRQSQGIYDTTAARLQNLSDEFKNFAAQAGGPFAAGIGEIAQALSAVMKFLTDLGPLVPILGTVASLVAVGGGAWVAYQIILSKTIQSMLATRELQRSLGVSTLSLSTAMQVYRGELSAANAASTQTAASMQQQATASGRLAVSMGAASEAHFANARASQASATAMLEQFVATQRSSAAINSSLPGLRAYAAASDQAAAASARQATAASLQGRQTQAQIASMTLAGTQMRNLAVASEQNAAAQLGGATATFASNRALQQQVAAATAAANAQRGLATANAQSAAAITAVASNSSRAANSIAQTGIAARAASFAFGPWGIAIGLVAVTLGSMIPSLIDFTSESEKMAQSAFEAAGGQKALAAAIKEDTDAMREGVEPYRVISAAQDEYSQKNREAAQAAKDKAQAEINAIEATAGSADELRRQAASQGESASAARAYLSEIEKQEGVIRNTTAALNENSLAYGKNASEALLAAAQEALASSEIVKGNESAARSMQQLSDVGLDIGKVLQQAYRDPEKAIARLDTALSDLAKTQDDFIKPRERGPFGIFGYDSGDERKLASQQKSLSNTATTLKALQSIIREHSDSANEADQANKILADALKGVGENAEVARGGIKLTTENLNELGATSDEAGQQIDKIASSLEGFGTPLTAFNAAAEKAFGGVKKGSGDAEKAISQFSLSSRGSLDLFLKELDKISKAQQDWSANLVKISATLGTDIAQGLANLGPEAAPMIAELADLSEKELEKLKPRLASLGRGSMEELAAGMLKQMSSLQNVSKRIRDEFAAGLGRDLSGASSPQQFNEISEAYDKLAERVSKKKIVPEIAVDAVKAEVDIVRFLQSLQTADKLKLEPNILFNQAETAADFNRVFAIIDSLARAKKANIDIDMDDAPARLTLAQLQAWVLNQEVQGLLDAEGKAVMNDADFRKRVQALANLVLGKKAAGEFDVNGDGKFNDKEFKKLFDALMKYIDGNRKKFDVTGTANLNDNATPKLNGIMQAMNNFRQNNTVTAYANVVQTTYRRQVDQGTRGGGGTMRAASGGYISGPGGPTSDSIPAWLSDGEYVINARATKKHRALLDKINSSGRRAASSMPFHYASGGHVTNPLRTQNAAISRAAEASFARAGEAMVSKLNRMSDRRVQLPRERMGPVITVNNTYPREEPTSITINRALAYSAALNGTL